MNFGLVYLVIEVTASWRCLDSICEPLSVGGIYAAASRRASSSTRTRQYPAP